MRRRLVLAAILLMGGALPVLADDPEAVGRWSLTVTKDSATGSPMTTAVLPGDPAETRLVLQCIPSEGSKDLFVGVVVNADMDFRTQGKGTFQIDGNPPVAAKWAFLERMMILNEVDQPNFNAELLRQLGAATSLTVQSRTSDGNLFSARFALDRVSDVVRRLFDACDVR
jgi:hypothetical protein